MTRKKKVYVFGYFWASTIHKRCSISEVTDWRKSPSAVPLSDLPVVVFVCLHEYRSLVRSSVAIICWRLFASRSTFMSFTAVNANVSPTVLVSDRVIMPLSSPRRGHNSRMHWFHSRTKDSIPVCSVTEILIRRMLGRLFGEINPFQCSNEPFSEKLPRASHSNSSRCIIDVTMHHTCENRQRFIFKSARFRTSTRIDEFTNGPTVLS